MKDLEENTSQAFNNFEIESDEEDKVDDALRHWKKALRQFINSTKNDVIDDFNSKEDKEANGNDTSKNEEKGVGDNGEPNDKGDRIINAPNKREKPVTDDILKLDDKTEVDNGFDTNITVHNNDENDNVDSGGKGERFDEIYDNKDKDFGDIAFGHDMKVVNEAKKIDNHRFIDTSENEDISHGDNNDNEASGEFKIEDCRLEESVDKINAKDAKNTLDNVANTPIDTNTDIQLTADESSSENDVAFADSDQDTVLDFDGNLGDSDENVKNPGEYLSKIQGNENQIYPSLKRINRVQATSERKKLLKTHHDDSKIINSEQNIDNDSNLVDNNLKQQNSTDNGTHGVESNVRESINLSKTNENIDLSSANKNNGTSIANENNGTSNANENNGESSAYENNGTSIANENNGTSSTNENNATSSANGNNGTSNTKETDGILDASKVNEIINPLNVNKTNETSNVKKIDDKLNSNDNTIEENAAFEKYKYGLIKPLELIGQDIEVEVIYSGTFPVNLLLLPVVNKEAFEELNVRLTSIENIPLKELR